MLKKDPSTPGSKKAVNKLPPPARPTPNRGGHDHDPRFCHDLPCRCGYPTPKLHAIRASEIHRYPTIQTSDGKTFQVDANGLVGPPRRYPIYEPPAELEIETAMTWFEGLADYQIDGKRQIWYVCQEVRYYLKALRKYAGQGAMAIACSRLGIPLKDDDGFSTPGLNYMLKLPAAWFQSIKLQVTR